MIQQTITKAWPKPERQASEVALLDKGVLEALRVALSYVEKVAATAPTEPARVRRQRQAAGDALMTCRVIAAVEAGR